MEFIYSPRWCELMFENRNKKYGAYKIRMREADNTAVAWLFSATFLILVVAALAWSGGPSKALIDKYTNPLTDDGTFTFSDFMPPLPKAEVPKTPSTSNQNTVPIVVDDKIIVDDRKTISVITPVTPVGAGGSGDITIPTGNGGPGGGLQPIEVTQPLLVADVMPEFPGGNEAMLRYLEKNIHYPPDLVKDGIGGIVYMQFVVDKDGSVTGIKILRGVKDGQALADEATRVVSKMPVWKPGIQGGKNVPVIYTLPVNFMVK